MKKVSLAFDTYGTGEVMQENTFVKYF